MTALAYRVRVRRALPRARRTGPRVLERIGRRARRLPGETDAARGRAAAGAVLGVLLLWSSTTGWRSLAAIPLGVWGGMRAGVAVAERERRSDQARARAGLPAVLDRLTICVLAGMSVERAVRTVAPSAEGLLGQALHEGMRSLDVGMSRAQAYERIASRAGLPELRAVLAALARADRFGTSVADALVAQADELRSRARAQAETEARTAPVKLIFPLVLCFLPAFVLLTIAPIAMSAVRTLSGL